MRALLSALLTVPLLASAGGQQAVVPRSDGCRMAVTARPDNTSQHTPSDHYDRWRASIGAIYPLHQMLARRRQATIGRVRYSLLAYQTRPAQPVYLSAFAMDGEGKRSWSLGAICSFGEWLAGLERMMDALRALPELPRGPSRSR